MPAAIIGRGRILLPNHAAKNCGVVAKMRAVQAHELCPELVDLSPDPSREGRAFEPVVSAAAQLAANLEVLRPGILTAPAVGPSKWAGGELQLQELLIETIVSATGAEVMVGIADTLAAAWLAAQENRILPPGKTAHYLSNITLSEVVHLGLLDYSQAQLDDLLAVMLGLGLDTCGKLAQAPKNAVYARFGDLGLELWNLASGNDIAVVAKSQHTPQIRVQIDCDPGLETVEMAGFVAKRAADLLISKLQGRGYSLRGVTIQAVTESAKHLERTWLLLGEKSAVAIRDRVRWQLQGWLQNGSLAEIITQLTLVAVDPYPAGEVGESLWGTANAKTAAAYRLISRLQTTLGEAEVKQPFYQGGYDPRSAVKVEKYHAPRNLALGALKLDREGALREIGKWPEIVLERPLPVQVVDSEDKSILIDAAGEMSSTPAWLKIGKGIKAAESRILRELLGGDCVAIEKQSPVWQVWGQWWCVKEGNYENPRAYLIASLGGKKIDILLCYQQGGWLIDGVYT
nr:DNA polymerase Y family protein [Boudabousia marimammalium]